MRELVFFDLDNTLIRGQSQIHFVSYLYRRGIIERYLYFKLVLWLIGYKAGMVGTPRSVMEHAVTFLRGREPTEVKDLVRGFLDETLDNLLFREALVILDRHRQERRETLLVSNAIEPIACEIGHRLNLSYTLCTKLEVKGNSYTGRLDGGITYGENKVQRVKEFIASGNLSLDGSWAYCDHISDLPLLESVSHPVAVNPDRWLRREAEKRNWPILVFKK